jgi:hypothetical protein
LLTGVGGTVAASNENGHARLVSAREEDLK